MEKGVGDEASSSSYTAARGRFTLQLLGPFTLLDLQGRPLPLRGRKARALLGRLALARGRSLRRDALSALLWEARSEPEARGSLRQALTELRRALGPDATTLLLHDDETVTLAIDRFAVDVLELERLCTVPKPIELDRMAALATLRLFDDLVTLPEPFLDWLEQERTRLYELVSGALERWLETVTATGDDGFGAVMIARALLAVEPAHEPAHRFVMRTHAARGDTAAALRQFETCKKELQRRLDARPSQATMDLAQTIRHGGVDNTRLAQATVIGTRKLLQALGPSVIVLPFLDPYGRDLGNGAHGLQEELASALARVRFLRVMPPALGQLSTGTSLDLEYIGRRLGAQYIVTGVVHRGSGLARVTASLVEYATGRTLLTEAGNLTEKPDPVSGRSLPDTTISRFASEIFTNEIRNAVSEPADDIALNLTFRSIPAFYELAPRRLDDARTMLDRALALDASLVLALCFQSFNRIIRLRPCSPAERADLLGGALELAGHAAELDPRDSLALSFYAHARVLNGEHDEAFDLQRRAMAANPLNPAVHSRHAVVQCLLGDHEGGLAAFDRYIELSPHDPFRRYFGGVRSMICMLAGRLDESVSAGKETMAELPQLGSGYRSTIAALGHLGRIDEARPLVQRLLEIEPGFQVDRYVATFPLRREVDRQRLAQGMRLAGLR